MSATSEELFLQYRGQIVPRSFNIGFVALSYVVSLIGAGSTLELINRRTAPKGKFNHLMLFSSAVTMGGIAIWCMHFIGNRAIDLASGEPELQIAYSGGFTALSFFVPILVLLAAFVAIGTNNVVSWWRVITGGVLAGSAICGMHYLGNASINNYSCVYELKNVIGAALIAVAASIVALAMFFVFRAAWANAWWKRLASAVVLAGAVSGMHWCASTGTHYRLERVERDQALSRNTTVIVVICLCLGACSILAGIVIYTARVMRGYASKAQKVTLATAVFDRQGRLLVNPDGLIPTETITDTFLGKNSNETFSTAHPLFHWMFKASRNWSGISALIPGITNHVHHLLREGRGPDGHNGTNATDEHSEMAQKDDIIYRELFCVAAVTLAEKLKEHLTSVGVLWDEILPTGGGGERPVPQMQRRQREADTVRKGNAAVQSVDLEEKGVRHPKQEYGRGSLMFLVRRVENDRDVENLEAAGYRFAELSRVSGALGSTLQVKTRDFEGKLRDMFTYVGESNDIEPGVHLGFFGIRARVGSVGFDVLVRRGARNLLPSIKMPLDKLESWHLDFIQLLDRMTVSTVIKKLDDSKRLSSKEKVFASQFVDTLKALRARVEDPIFDDAVLTCTPVSLPSRSTTGASSPARTSLLAFRLVIPIHANVVSPTCEFIPLNFFKVHRLSARSSPHHLAFVRSVHRELGSVINSVPAAGTRPGSRLRPDAHMPRRIRSLFRADSLAVDGDGNPIPTVFGRSSSPSPSNQSSSTLRLWERRGSHQPSSKDSSVSRRDYPQPQTANFGGIMVSQEITVNVREAGDEDDNTSPRSPRQRKSLLTRKLSRKEGGRRRADQGPDITHGRGPGSQSTIELNDLPEVRTNVHADVSIRVSNAEEERNDEASFVNELFAACVESR